MEPSTAVFAKGIGSSFVCWTGQRQLTALLGRCSASEGFEPETSGKVTLSDITQEAMPPSPQSSLLQGRHGLEAVCPLKWLYLYYLWLPVRGKAEQFCVAAIPHWPS